MLAPSLENFIRLKYARFTYKFNQNILLVYRIVILLPKDEYLRILLLNIFKL